jgi:hypothetical protein
VGQILIPRCDELPTLLVTELLEFGFVQENLCSDIKTTRSFQGGWNHKVRKILKVAYDLMLVNLLEFADLVTSFRFIFTLDLQTFYFRLDEFTRREVNVPTPTEVRDVLGKAVSADLP